MSTSPARDLTIVSRSATRRPRALRQPRLEGLPGGSFDAAYRRLAAVMLRLDVPTVASDLRAERQGRSLPHAA
jgi:hypothetical protein